MENGTGQERVPADGRTWLITLSVVVVLGVLPFLWHASVVWQVLGLAAAVTLTTHTTRRAPTGR